MTKDVVVLTKSAKMGGFCVAGIDARNGEWVRLVSSDSRSHGALSYKHLTYENGGICEVADCVRVEILRAVPVRHQPENLLIDDRKKFHKLETWSLRDVLRIHPAERFETVYTNTKPYLDERDIGHAGCSLILIRVPWLCVKRVRSYYGKSKIKADFEYNGRLYENISVTDPEYFYVKRSTTLSSVYIVVSLPDSPFDGRYYKFIAKIFT